MHPRKDSATFARSPLPVGPCRKKTCRSQISAFPSEASRSAPCTLISRRGFSRPTPRCPAHLPFPEQIDSLTIVLRISIDRRRCSLPILSNILPLQSAHFFSFNLNLRRPAFSNLLVCCIIAWVTCDRAFMRNSGVAHSNLLGRRVVSMIIHFHIHFVGVSS